MKKLFTLFAMLIAFGTAMATTYNVTATTASGMYYSSYGGYFVTLSDADLNFYFFINGITNMTAGTTYTHTDMNDDYSYLYNSINSSYSYYSSCSLSRNAAGDYSATVVTTDGNTYNVTYTAPTPITEPTDTVAITIADNNYTGRLTDIISASNVFQFYGTTADEAYVMYAAFSSSTTVPGTYTASDIVSEYTTIYHLTPTDTTQINYSNILGNATVTLNNGIYTLTMNMVGTDSVLYQINMQFHYPVATTTQTVTATDLTFNTQYWSSYSIFIPGFSNANYIVSIYIVGDGTTMDGSYTLDDIYYYNGNYYFIVKDGTTGDYINDVYSTNLTVSTTVNTRTLTGTALLYGDLQLTFNATGVDTPTSIEQIGSAAYQAYSEDRTIVLNGAEDQNAAIYDVAGRMICNSMVDSDNARFQIEMPGIYVIRVNGETLRVIVK